METQMGRILKYIQRDFSFNVEATANDMRHDVNGHSKIGTIAEIPDADDVSVQTSCDSQATQIALRSERVQAAFKNYRCYDYWLACQGGSATFRDPVNISLGRL